LSLSRRNVLMAGAAMLVAAGLSGPLLPRLIRPAHAQGNATNQTAPGAGGPANEGDLQAELAQPGPDGDVALGSDKAPVTIIEYASMTCPHCAHFSETTFPELKKRYIDTGKVRFIFREFPFDPVAAAGFMLARCAGKDRYMAVVETLFAKQEQWALDKAHAREPLQNIARQFGFTDETFKACLTNQKVLDDIEVVRNRAVQKLGVNSTPTFFVNGKKLTGDMPIDLLAKEIDPYLKAG